MIINSFKSGALAESLWEKNKQTRSLRKVYKKDFETII